MRKRFFLMKKLVYILENKINKIDKHMLLLKHKQMK